MQNDMTIYQNKTAICRTFGIGRQTMYRYEAGIREQIAQGRYNEYAIIDNEINVGVFADYIKYRRMLKDKNCSGSMCRPSICKRHWRWLYRRRWKMTQCERITREEVNRYGQKSKFTEYRLKKGVKQKSA